MSQPRGKILVIRGGAIGDFILTLPAISALRERFPQASLEVLGYPHIAQLALAGGLVDRVQSIEARALAGFFAGNGPLEESLADYFSEFDLIVSYLYDPDEIFKTNVSRCSLAQFIACPHRPDETSKLHATQVFLKPLERLAIFDADPQPRLSVVSSAARPRPLTAALRRLGEGGGEGAESDWLAVHPGSGSERKNWPETNWAHLLQRLVGTTESNFLLIGGEAEGERLQRLAAALPPTRLRLAQSLALSELAQCLGECQLFVGHDSGISHLAAALGLPGVLLWSNASVEVWRPPSGKMQILQHTAGLERLSVDEVLVAIQRAFSREVRPV